MQETGELYLFKHGHPLDGGGTVAVMERRFGLGELQAALRGFREVCGRPASLVWFLERVSHGAPLAASA